MTLARPLPLYAQPRTKRQRRWRTAAFIALGFWSFFTGAAFTFLPPSFIAPLLLPIVILALLFIWALPDTSNAPSRTMGWLFFGFFLSLGLWPNYLAIALPGLPWITVERLFSIPLACVLLVSMSVSRNFLSKLKEIISATPIVWKFVVAFAVTQFISVALSSDPFQSLQKFLISQIYWTSAFFVACYLFRRPGSVTAWVYILAATTFFNCLIGVWEWKLQAVPWAGHIPSFLKIEDESVQRILAGQRRAATGIYRIHSIFSTSLGLAEYLALTTPFLVHLVVESRHFWVRVAVGLLIPFVFLTIFRTDSRLGNVGFIASFILYFGLWAIWRWRSDKRSIFGPALALTYPMLMVAFIAATMVVGRLHVMIWGNGADQFSTQARIAQAHASWKLIFTGPLGHGAGQGASVLGFRNAAGVLTLDSYYLTIALEYGILGFIFYYGLFLASASYAVREGLRTPRDERSFIIPMAVSVAVFCIIKSVFSQQENHPIIFMIVGAICALAYRNQSDPHCREVLPQPTIAQDSR